MNRDRTVVSLRGISKRFPGVQALDDVDFDLERGEIHALLGENGAGKTTLMNVLYGLYDRDQGEIRVRGEAVEIDDPQDAMVRGIGMVHQLFRQVYRHTVCENVALASAPSVVFPEEGVRGELKSLMEQYGWTIDPDAQIWRLSAAERQKVEILKVLYQGAEILILDEPTSVLTPQGKKQLFENLETLQQDDYAIVFITHKLDEVMAISDRVTILRGGESMGTVSTDTVTKEGLARKMVGREVLFDVEKEPVEPGRTVLEVDDLWVRGDRGEDAVKGVTCSIREGEILGLAGVGGSGQKELMEAIAGLRPVQQGTVRLLDRDLTGRSPHDVIDAGVAYVPGERDRLALVPSMSVRENFVLKNYRREEFRNGFLLDWDTIERFAHDQIDRYGIVTTGPRARTSSMSGGNLQKLLLAREIEEHPRLLIAAYPTQGLDVGTIERIHRLLLDQRREGVAILLVSEDLDEVQRLSDRIGVLFEGRLMGVVEESAVTKQEIGMMMVGTPWEEVQMK